MARIFISHSSLDGDQASRLLAWLHSQGFVSTFLDFDKHHGLAPGSDWERTLYRELSGADAVILILTKNWFSSKWCFVEFAQARALGKAIFPLIEAPTGENYVSRDIQHLDLVKDREGGLDQLQSELTRIALNTRGGFLWDHTRSPYPGLLAFDEADAAIYFGRDDDIRRLIERLNSRRAQGGEKLVVILGASGSGKSSLLRAGIVPRLKRDPRNWVVLSPFRPQLRPLDELAQAVATGLGAGSNWRQWRDAFESENLVGELGDLARDLRDLHGQNEAQVLLIIDQGEELFASSEPKLTGKFFHVLNALLDERLPFMAAMSLRSDYLGRLQQEPGLTAPFEQFSLKPMPLERVREIIDGPAKVAGMLVDDGLVVAASADARTEDALPLLAFAMRELYVTATGSGRLTVEAYRALGDAEAQLSPLENAVRSKADEVLVATKPTPDELQALKEAFIPAMVRVNAEGEYVRRPTMLSALPPRALPLLERLSKARLLTILEDRSVVVVEVTHEALLRKWPLLRGWLDEEREFLIGKEQLEQDLREWERAALEQRTDALLTGLKLARSRLWLFAKPHQLTEAERKFIEASVARFEEEAATRERTRRRTLRGTVAAAIMLAIAAMSAAWEWRQAKVEESQAVSQQLAAQSLQHISNDNVLALREAVQAAERWHTAETEFALNAVLTAPRERYVLHHKSKVQTAVFSRDGKRILTASDDSTARLWSAEDGSLLLTLSGHTGAVNTAAFSPDGRRIVTASKDTTARIWDANNGHLLATLSGDAGEVETAEFSPDSKLILTVSSDSVLLLWDATNGQQLKRGGLFGFFFTFKKSSATFSPDGKRIVTVDENGLGLPAVEWDVASGEPVAHLEKAWSAVFSHDGTRIATAQLNVNGDKSGGVKVWDAEKGHLLFTLNVGPIADSIAFSPDGKRMIVINHYVSAQVWDIENGQMLFNVSGPANRITTAEFSADSKRIVTNADRTVRVWDANDGHLLGTLSGHTDTVNSASFSPDGRHILTASDDDTARVWDLDDGRLLSTFSAGIPVRTAAFSPDGQSVVTASQDDHHSAAQVWDARNGKVRSTLPIQKAQVTAAVFSPTGTSLVTAYNDGSAQEWNVADGRLLVTLQDNSVNAYPAVNSAAFSPDGRRVVTAPTGNVDLWDAESGRLLSALSSNDHPNGPNEPDSVSQVSPAAFSPDGRRIVAVTPGSVVVWKDDQLSIVFTGHLRTDGPYDIGDENSAAFSPDGRRIVTARGHSQTVRVWQADSEDALQLTLSGHTDEVNDAAFSPDSSRIVTASKDRTARLWDAATGRLLATFSGYTDAVNAAQYSRDGKLIVTASTDGTAKVYLVGFADLVKRAKQLLPIDSGN